MSLWDRVNTPGKCVPFKTGNYVYLIQVSTDGVDLGSICKLFYSKDSADRSLKCQTCFKRALKYLTLIDASGKFPWPPRGVCGELDNLAMQRDKLLRTSPACNFVMIKGDGGEISAFGDPRQVGGFDHVQLICSSSSIMQMHRHLGDILFKMYYDLINRILFETDADGMEESLDLLLNLIESSTNAHIIHFATDFLRTHMHRGFNTQSPHMQAVFVSRMLFDANITGVNSRNNVVATVIHQINNNVLDLLRTAKDETAMKQFLDARFNPLQYQRTTAPLREGQIDVARRTLGDFRVVTMTVEQMIRFFGAVRGFTTPILVGSASAYDSISRQCATHGRKTTATEFAARSRSYPSTVMELIKRLGEFPGLLILTDGHDAVYQCMMVPNKAFRDDGYDEEESIEFMHTHLQYEFPWLFRYGCARNYGIPTIARVMAVGLQGRQGTGRFNAFFATGDRIPHDESVPFFKEYIRPELGTHVGRVFEELKNTMKIETIGDGPYAVGVGVSCTASNKVSRSLVFYHDGHKFFIDRFV